MLDKVTHGVVELKSNRSVQNSSTCQSGNQSRVLSSWGLGSGLVSQVPYLGEALGVVGVKRRLNEDIFRTKHQLSLVQVMFVPTTWTIVISCPKILAFKQLS